MLSIHFASDSDVVIEFLLFGRIEISVVQQTVLRRDSVENAERRSLDTVVISGL
jgi:hypothetical protein